MAKIELYVAVEINDDAAAILNASDDVGAVELVMGITRNALTGTPGFLSVSVDAAEVTDDPDSVADEIESAPATPAGRDVPKGRTGLTDRQVTKAYRSGIPVVGTKGGPSGRTGRPATLHDWHAEDGEPVRASGPRSIENLTASGIQVWQDGDEPKRPAVKRNTGERAPAVKSTGPTLKARRTK